MAATTRTTTSAERTVEALLALDSVHEWTPAETQRVRDHFLREAGAQALAAEKAKGARDAALHLLAGIDYALERAPEQRH